VDRDLLRAAPYQVGVEMVVQILAHPGHVADHRDPELAQELGRAESGKLQQLRRTVDAAGDDDLASHPRGHMPGRRVIFDPDRAVVLEQNAGGVCVGRDRQVLTAACRPEIGPRGAPAPAVSSGCLVIADTFLPGAVEVIDCRNSRLDRGCHHRVAEWRTHRVRYVQRPADTVKLVGAALLVLRLLEERQYRIPIPAVAAALTPTVVIRRGAAHINHAVDRAGAAQDLAARLVEGAVVELLLGLALEHPVVARVGKGLGIAERDVDPRVAVASARFEQQHAPATGFAEPPGHRTARRSRAGHDEVISVVGRRHYPTPLLLRVTITKPAGSVKGGPGEHGRWPRLPSRLASFRLAGGAGAAGDLRRWRHR